MDTKTDITKNLELVLIHLRNMKNAMVDYEGVYSHYIRLTGVSFSHFPKEIFSTAKGIVTDAIEASVAILSNNADNAEALQVLGIMALLDMGVNDVRFDVVITQKDNKVLKTAIEAINYIKGILAINN